MIMAATAGNVTRGRREKCKTAEEDGSEGLEERGNAQKRMKKEEKKKNGQRD
jgi:hypothetical protein